MNTKVNKPYESKLFAVLLMLVGLVDLASIVYKFFAYRFEYDPTFSPVDYGRIKYVMFFTVESNFLVSVYLILLALTVFGVKKLARLTFNPTVSCFLTTYIIITGLVYCSGIFLGMTEPSKWDTFYHFVSSGNQILHHMIVPPFMVLLYLLPPTNESFPKKRVWLVGIYPLVYSLFSIIRGAVSRLHFYPYPVYKPDFYTDLFFGGRQVSVGLLYLSMLPVLIVGIMIFILLARLLLFIKDKGNKKREGK